jgi:hypothetical protein
LGERASEKISQRADASRQGTRSGGRNLTARWKLLLLS